MLTWLLRHLGIAAILAAILQPEIRISGAATAATLITLAYINKSINDN